MKQLASTFTGKYPQKNAIKAMHRSNLKEYMYFFDKNDKNDSTTLCVCHLLLSLSEIFNIETYSEIDPEHKYEYESSIANSGEGKFIFFMKS